MESMRALVVYESMYGNTHTIADHVAEGLRPAFETTVVPVDAATAARVDTADLVVVGGPTHAHGLTTTQTRHAARDAAEKKDTELDLDPDAEGPGLRDWFHQLAGNHRHGAAFDTRFTAAPIITGRASKGIARRLRHHGFELIVDPESFLVDADNHLVEGESDRARVWGAAIAEALGSAGARPTS